MTQPLPSIARVMALTLVGAVVGCSALADGNQALSLEQRMASAGSVLARTVTLLSAPAGLPEGTVVNQPSMVAMNGLTLPEPTPCVVTHTEAWGAPFPGASYVSSCPDCGSALPRCGGGFTPEAPSSISFVHTFELPPGFSSPSFSMTTTNDDAANVYVNGAYIGRAETCCGPFPGQVVTKLHSEDPSVFRVGTNELRYDLENFNAPCSLSMAYVATVTFQGGEEAPQ